MPASPSVYIEGVPTIATHVDVLFRDPTDPPADLNLPSAWRLLRRSKVTGTANEKGVLVETIELTGADDRPGRIFNTRSVVIATGQTPVVGPLSARYDWHNRAPRSESGVALIVALGSPSAQVSLAEVFPDDDPLDSLTYEAVGALPAGVTIVKAALRVDASQLRAVATANVRAVDSKGQPSSTVAIPVAVLAELTLPKVTSLYVAGGTEIDTVFSAPVPPGTSLRVETAPALDGTVSTPWSAYRVYAIGAGQQTFNQPLGDTPQEPLLEPGQRVRVRLEAGEETSDWVTAFANRAPVVVGTVDEVFQVGTIYNRIPAAKIVADPDGELLTYSLVGAPGWVSLDGRDVVVNVSQARARTTFGVTGRDARALTATAQMAVTVVATGPPEAPGSLTYIP